MPVEVPSYEEYSTTFTALNSANKLLAENQQALNRELAALQARVEALEADQEVVTPVAYIGSSAQVDDGESQAQAFERVEALLGPLDIYRVFDGGKGWGKVESIAATLPKDKALCVSAKNHIITKNEYDRITDRDGEVWFVYHHEPEDDIEDSKKALTLGVLA